MPAQAQGAQRVMPPPLADFVPQSARLFITISRPKDVDAAMERAHAWRLLPLLAGIQDSSHATFSLERTLREFLGTQRAIRLDEIMDAQLGIMAPAWTKLGQASWLVRPRNPDVLPRWLPKLSKNPANTFFGMESGLVVCARNKTVLLNRGGGGAVFGDAVRLIAGQTGVSLNRDRLYQELLSFLPGKPLAVAYVNDPPSKDRRLPDWPIALDQAVVGLYEGQGRLDFALRGVRQNARPSPTLKPETIKRLLSLPRTSLLVSAFSPALDADGLTPSPSSGTSSFLTLRRILTLLRGMGGSIPALDPLGSLGSQVIFAWDQDFRSESSTPQLAVLVECTDGQAVKTALDEAFSNVLRLLSAMDPGLADTMPEIQSSTHLGVETRSLPLNQYVRRSSHDIIRLLERVEPCWAVMGDWLIVALSRDHVERIIDAHRALAPTLASVPDVAAIAKRTVRRTSLTFVQSDLAAEVVQAWLVDLEAGKPSLLAPRFWNAQATARSAGPTRLGIGMAADSTPGAVTVARVYPQTVADGVLQVDDRILGVDGRLLDLSQANMDLRHRWAHPNPHAEFMVFRIHRGEELLDVKVPVRKTLAITDHTSVLPADALKELVSLGMSLQFASIASFESTQDRYSARVSLRFKPTP
ncbi:MAG: hypothetical protein ACE5E5_08665 [Phycisphaerae bacterium]